MAQPADTTMHVARNLSLPDDAVTQTFAFLGRKGSGKTYAAGRLAEGFLEAGVQTVVLDPVGNWYGLRLNRSGKGASDFTLPILGGQHADAPLEPTSGSVVADFLVDTGTSAILDVSSFRKADRKRFTTAFAEQLFERKKTARTPCHLFIEEAQVFCPEQVSKGQEAMIGAIEDIVRLGRNLGIGCSMISQRPQSVNKEILNQAEPLIVFQLVAHHEREAVRRWMKHVGVDALEMLNELPSLGVGDCFFWSPAWMDAFLKTRFLQKSTYDASATPKLGETRQAPAKLKPVDLQALEVSMAESIERAKENDPAELKRRIRDLEKQLAKAGDGYSEQQVREMIDAAAVAAAHGERTRIAKDLEEFDIMVRLASGKLNGFLKSIDTRYETSPPPTPPKIDRPPAPAPSKAATQPPPRGVTANGSLSKPQAAILSALYWLKDEPFRKETVSFYSGYSHRSSSFGNTFSQLRGAGYVEGNRITEAGIDAIQATVGPKPNGATLREWMRPRLSGPANAFLDALVARHPHRVGYEEISDATGYSVTSSSFGNTLSELRSAGAATGSKAEGMVAADELVG